MKCFEILVKDHITSTLPDPLQFAYRPNRSTDDAFAITLHTVLNHLDKRNTYVRMLFINYSSAFNTIVPSKLITKLGALGPGLPDGPTQGDEGRQQHLCCTDPQPVLACSHMMAWPCSSPIQSSINRLQGGVEDIGGVVPGK